MWWVANHWDEAACRQWVETQYWPSISIEVNLFFYSVQKRGPQWTTCDPEPLGHMYTDRRRRVPWIEKPFSEKIMVQLQDRIRKEVIRSGLWWNPSGVWVQHQDYPEPHVDWSFMPPLMAQLTWGDEDGLKRLRDLAWERCHPWFHLLCHRIYMDYLVNQVKYVWFQERWKRWWRQPLLVEPRRGLNPAQKVIVKRLWGEEAFAWFHLIPTIYDETVDCSMMAEAELERALPFELVKLILYYAVKPTG